MIHDFIKNICDILDIPTPLISHNTSNFPTETMLAQVDSLGSTIYIRKFDKPNPDLFFLSHMNCVMFGRLDITKKNTYLLMKAWTSLNLLNNITCNLQKLMLMLLHTLLW